MNENERRKIILKKMLSELELPDSAYEKAISRYEDLGKWFSRKDSPLAGHDPHIFPQGSFRLGTATRPIDDDNFYDLDLSCKLRAGIEKDTHTQKQLKAKVKDELESYRKMRGIKEEIIPKHRCWRLEYQDDLSFHMDIVPCIPESEQRRQIIQESLVKSGDSDGALISSDLTCSITDDRDPNFDKITDDWNISNPEGYANWFERKVRTRQIFNLLEKAQVDEVPLYKKKAPLQQAIQILKRHRDLMFKENEDSKPISIIITTLAARAYSGETDLGECLENILSRMKSLVNSSSPRVPNPVDPGEDFADRWGMDKYKGLKLEENFWLWLKQAQIDFKLLGTSTEPKFVSNQALAKFALHLDENDLAKSFGTTSPSVVSPKVHVIKEEAKPWSEDVDA